MSTSPTTLVVLGAGYAGLFAARRAVQAIPASRRGSVRVVLVDRERSWVERTRWHQLAAGEGVAHRPLHSLFRGTGVEVLHATVGSIALDERVVTFTDDPATPPLPFERLVYTLGSHSNAALVPGAVEHALTLDTPASSRQVGQRLAGRPESRVTVVGGGLTGLQAATQIAERHPAARVSLVSSGALARELPDRARSYVHDTLGRRGVEVIEGRVSAVDESGCHTDGGSVSADLVVWAAGFVPAEPATASGLAVDDSGQVMVDPTLRSVSHPFVFAAGDSAAVHRAASSFGAYAATGTGATAGRNAALDLLGLEPEPLDLGYAFLGVSLGRHDAVLQLLRPDGTPRDRMLTGRIAHALKEGVEHYVSGALKAERRLPGLYHWAPAEH